MRRYGQYAAEFTLVLLTMVVGFLGFWSLYVGESASAQPHHHLHVATTFTWMALLFAQLILLARGRWTQHRRLGLAVLVAAPVLVASTAMLTVHSAHRAVVAGEPDALLVQNVTGTAWLAVTLCLAFALKARRKVHGALLASTLILFLGPALFFSLIAFAPPFRIEGPETFYRFGTAAMTGQAIILVLAVLLFAKDWRNGWPYLLAASSFLVAEAIRATLTGLDLIDPLLRIVGAPGRTVAFGVTLVVMALVLAALVLPRPARPLGARTGIAA